MTEKKPKIVLKRAKNRQFYFVLLAANGATLMQSETYISRRNANKGIVAVQTAFHLYGVLDVVDHVPA